MAKKYEAEIKELEMRARLNAQENSRYNLKAEKLKLLGRVEDIDKTISDLDTAIAETKVALGEA
jgi:hypothetical protein